MKVRVGSNVQVVDTQRDRPLPGDAVRHTHVGQRRATDAGVCGAVRVAVVERAVLGATVASAGRRRPQVPCWQFALWQRVGRMARNSGKDRRPALEPRYPGCTGIRYVGGRVHRQRRRLVAQHQGCRDRWRFGRDQRRERRQRAVLTRVRGCVVGCGLSPWLAPCPRGCNERHPVDRAHLHQRFALRVSRCTRQQRHRTVEQQCDGEEPKGPTRCGLAQVHESNYCAGSTLDGRWLWNHPP